MSAAEQYVQQGMNVREAVIFLVDWRTAMIRKDNAINVPGSMCSDTGLPSLLSITLRCIADLMKTKIVARNKDSIAVIAFGARGKHTRQGWPGVRLLRPLSQADAAGIRQMQGIARRLEEGDGDALITMGSEELTELEVDDDDGDFSFGPDVPVEFDKALWAVRHHFTAVIAGRGTILHRKRVIVFTNDDDPSGGKHAVKQLCLTQVKDLAELGASLDVSLLTSPGKLSGTVSERESGGSSFFNDLVYSEEGNGDNDRGTVMISTVYSFDDMMMSVRKKEMIKRAVRRTVLVMGNDYKIGVASYALLKKATRPVKCELDASTNKPLFKITTAACENTGEVLAATDVRHTFTPDFLKNTPRRLRDAEKLRGEADQPQLDSHPASVFGFRKSELVQAKAIGSLGIVLFGFRTQAAFRKEYTLSAPQFLFADDSEYTGSTNAFAVLLKCMLDRKVVGIASVRLSEKNGTGMRFAALLPQREEKGKDGDPDVPGGLFLYYMPYKNDIYTAWRTQVTKEQRETGDALIAEEEEMEHSELNEVPESVAWARRMVRSMKIKKYSPYLFLNPDLQRFYAGLENAAGVESKYNPQDELLNPNVEAMESRGGTFANEVKRIEVGIDFDGEAMANEFGTVGNKRAAATVKRDAKRKADREKTRKEAAAHVNNDIYITRYREGILHKMLKADLHLYCRAHGLSEKGTKKELLVHVEDHIEETLNRAATSLPSAK